MDEIPRIDLADVLVDPAWAVRVSPQIALRRLILPICVIDGELVTAMADPSDRQAALAVSAAIKKPLRIVSADAAQLRAMLLRIYGDTRSTTQANGDDPVAIVDGILRSAVIRRASDIHFDPERESFRVRLRVDGSLEEFTRIPSSLQPAVISRLKVLSGLDIAEKRAPQDGGFSWKMPGQNAEPFDIRVATLPVRHGERVTLRLLESGKDRLDLDSLGMSVPDRKSFEKILARPHGLVLLTGPTGSGKTTTLYAAIRALLDREMLNILTVEDPIEYEIDGISQAEVDSGDKVNFSKALRSLLRHDPDVIMIGEIRDEESLDTAVKAALTGHLVLSTLHTNDAVSAVTRLLDMGMEPHKIAATLRVSAAQRLVRNLCPHCRERYVIEESEAVISGYPQLAGKAAFRPKGCLKCAGRGCLGRSGIFELMIPDEEIAALIAASAPVGEIYNALRAKGFRTLADDAVEKILAGTTSLAEVSRIAAV